MSFADPRKNIQHLFLSEGMKVADFGAGPGHYANLASDIVGEHGEVYLIDIQRPLLTKAKSLDNIRRHNLRFICCDIEGPDGTGIRGEYLDAVIVSNLLFQLDDKAACAREAFKILKGGGRILLIDWSDSWGGIGPHQDHVVPIDAVKPLFMTEGFSFKRDFDAGEHHWGLVMEKPHHGK